jgi:hypothetical protein
VAPDVLELRPDYRVLVMVAEGLEPGSPDEISDELLARATPAYFLHSCGYAGGCRPWPVIRRSRRLLRHARIACVSVTAEDIEREKDRLPRGWGRFGKAIEQLAGIGEPDESLLSSCVTLNPQFRHTSVSLAGGLLEMTDSTNVVLAASSKRLIVISTGMGGAPRKHYDLSWDGLQIGERSKTEFTLRTQAGEIRFRGAAKSMVPGFLDAVEAKAGDAERQ